MLKNSPLREAIYQIRFKSDIPEEAVFGVAWSAVKDLLKGYQIIQLPIQQIPSNVRNQDSNLKYQPLQRIQKDNLSVSVGPNTIIFANSTEYIGWKSWFSKIVELTDRLIPTRLLDVVERTGLRYTNIFNENILEGGVVKISLNEQRLLNETTNLRTEIKSGEFIKILQIGNSITFKFSDNAQIGSLIDIDVICNNFTNSFSNTYIEKANMAHSLGKEMFFSLLSADQLQKLGPIYKESK